MASFELQIYGHSARVLGANGRVVFAGSLRACEDWLDAAEIRARLHEATVERAARPGFLARYLAKCLSGERAAACR